MKHDRLEYEDAGSESVIAYVVFAVILFCLILGLSYLIFSNTTPAFATEAPGCGNQHYRPRLAQCCPKYLANEALPPKCTHALADGFLQECCEPGEPEPSPYPSPTCPAGWNCWPTPEPSPITKNQCCRDVQQGYKEQRLEIVDRYRVEMHALRRWKKESMQVCRESYAR